MAGVELIELTKRFGQITIIDRLTLRMEESEFLAFLGPSGCGKSTLLRMIAGLESIDSGEVRIGGRRIDLLPPGARGVAMVFQNYALYPHMSARENIAFGLRNAGMPAAEIEQRIASAADMLEITALLERKPDALSGGERQRVAIARAIVKDPDLFLFDEPMSNLDAALRLRTRLELAQLRLRVRAAMMFVTHDQVEAMTLADRIVVMSKQGVEQIGAPMQVYTRPATRFVASFVGTPRINLLPASIENGPEGFAIARVNGALAIPTRVPLDALPSSTSFEIGLRPDAIALAPPESGDAAAIVDLVERLGDRAHVYARLADGAKVVCDNTAQVTLKPGDTVGLRFTGGEAHLFDASGRAHHADAR